MSSHIEWTPEMEINLFYAMIDHKPVGENKHFHMMFIYEKFNNLNEKKLSIEQLWEHLANLYDLQALVDNLYRYALKKDDVEVVPYPNEEIEFSLPDMDTSTKSSNSDDLESSIKSTSTSGGGGGSGKNEPNKTTSATTTTSTPAGKESLAAKLTPQQHTSSNRASLGASKQSKKK